MGKKKSKKAHAISRSNILNWLTDIDARLAALTNLVHNEEIVELPAKKPAPEKDLLISSADLDLVQDILPWKKRGKMAYSVREELLPAMAKAVSDFRERLNAMEQYELAARKVRAELEIEEDCDGNWLNSLVPEIQALKTEIKRLENRPR